jgi:hypothetical protein
VQKKSILKIRRGFVAVSVSFAVLALGGCGDDTSNVDEPVIVPESELEFVPQSSTAPPLETTDTSFWAVKGADSELEIRYAGQGGPGTGQRFLEFKLEEETLWRYPDGTLFQDGDSIEIFVTVDSDLFLVDLEPSGLRFNADEPAVLEFEYELADDDFLVRESEFEAWRQELVGEPWMMIESVKIEDFDEIEIRLLGFTRYAMAVGR